jgi:hypothetical protein
MSHPLNSSAQGCRMAAGSEFHVPNPNLGGYDGNSALSGPSMVRIVAEPAPEEEQTLLGFLEEVSLGPKKRDRDAKSSILQPNSSHIATEIAGEKVALLQCCKTKPPHQPKLKNKQENYHD